MKKVLIPIVLAAVLVMALTVPAVATGPIQNGNGNFGGNSGTWEEDATNDDNFINTNNPGNRKSWDDHVFVQPGQAWDHANENAAAKDHNVTSGETQVDPHGFYP